LLHNDAKKKISYSSTCIKGIFLMQPNRCDSEGHRSLFHFHAELTKPTVAKKQK